ncbi:RDD domain-containing protein [Pseudomonas cichorii]|uniref:RDD domain-containing protein n=1 Tax=Pseudomonas cichorii TaxID=36746 RepID=A0A3M4LUV0_PSECI|nr:RDD family protein [Pseudomonas cichorii]RMQ45225.1 RDD domain-containing protein [Pseudomonas cichorii]
MSSPPAPPRNAAPPAPLDTRIGIETPEGIDLVMRPAGLLPRALAFGIDFGIRALTISVLIMFFRLFDKLGTGLGAIAMFLVNWWYMVLFEVLNQGSTPGKRLMGLRVVQDDGTPIGWAASLIRNLLRFVDMLPFGYGLGAVSCLSHPLFKRLGDLAAGTCVIYRDTPVQRPVLPQAEPVIAPFTLTLDEQRALMDLAERQGELSAARTEELAAILAGPLHVPRDKAVAHINGLARGLLGPT